MGHSIRGFSAGQSTRYGLNKVQCIAWVIPGTNQKGMGKAPVAKQEEVSQMLAWWKHGMTLTSKLPKDHLLPGFHGFGLNDQGGGGSRVQVREETPGTGFSPSGQLSAELDPFLNGLEVVLVFALLGALSLKDV